MAATRKITKYDHLLASHHFVPVAFETLSPINNSGLDFTKNLGFLVKSRISIRISVLL